MSIFEEYAALCVIYEMKIPFLSYFVVNMTFISSRGGKKKYVSFVASPHMNYSLFHFNR